MNVVRVNRASILGMDQLLSTKLAQNCYTINPATKFISSICSRIRKNSGVGRCTTRILANSATKPPILHSGSHPAKCET